MKLQTVTIDNHSEPPRWVYRFDNYKQAFILLRAAITKLETVGLNQLEKEGTIQRFEYKKLQTTNLIKIPITKKGRSYKEFPSHNKLRDFDPDDHMFIAVANAHPDKPPIKQATDQEWYDYRNTFKQVGITIDFICPNDLQ